MVAVDLTLPALREDLQLLAGPPAADGSPTWTIFDPVRSRYFRVGWSAFQMLSRWSAGTVRVLVSEVVRHTTCHINSADVLQLVRFLHANSLTVGSASGRTDDYLAQYQTAKPHWLLWLIHNYLFFRVPLLRPERFLRATLPYVEPLFSRTVAYLGLGMALAGLYLVSRQWDTFKATFLHFFTWQGAALYALALAATKVLHELGHAYTATRYGCRVPTMGVAFLVLFPVLYTDVTDAWRLTSRRQRLHIGAAGMLTELWLAAACTLAWSFLPDGAWRSTVFIVATATWIITLAVNLTPFMRFDGYYLLADWLGVDNLQSRSFDLARWRLRQWLFAVPEARPELVPPELERKMIAYAWATWLYRLVVFTGIALLVYHLFFKLLGVVLFAIEIGWFIVLPIVRELQVWWRMRTQAIRTRRTMVLATLIAGALLLLFIPWSGRIQFPAVMEAAQHTTVYAPEPGRIAAVLVKPGQPVQQGDVLLKLESPQLDDDIARSEKRLEFFRLRSLRAATNPQDLADTQVVMQQLATESSRQRGLRKKRDNLVIRAPLTGVVMDVAESLDRGRWIDAQLPIALIVDPKTVELKGVVAETDVARLALHQSATFYSDDPTRGPLDARIIEIGETDVQEVDWPYLASVYGGSVAVRYGAEGQLQPESSLYRVRLEMPGAALPPQVVRGVVHVKAEPQSFAKRGYDLVASVLIRESGF